MGTVAEAGEDAVRKGRNRRIAGRARISESQRDGVDTNNRGDEGQRPDGAPRCKRLGLQNAEMLGRFVVSAHGVSNAGTGFHATERGADQGRKDRKGFSQHEVLAIAVPQQPIADDDHHVANRRWGARRVLHRVARVEKVVGRKVLDQITDLASTKRIP